MRAELQEVVWLRNDLSGSTAHGGFSNLSQLCLGCWLNTNSDKGSVSPRAEGFSALGD